MPEDGGEQLMRSPDADEAVWIVNPAAGVRGRRSVEDRIRSDVPGALILHTRRPGEATDIARDMEAKGYRTVIAVGGDGTLSEVANGLLADGAGNSVRLGFVPAGTCNDFVRGRAVATDLRALLVSARAQQVDVGSVTYTPSGGGVETRFFLVGCTIGLVSTIGVRFTEKTTVNRIIKRISLPLAEVMTGIRTIARWRPVRLNLELDDEQMECSATNLAVMKVPFFAGGLTFGAGGAADSGLLDLVLVEALSRPRVVGMMWTLFRGKAEGHPSVRRWSVRRVLVDAEHPVPLEVDGEIVGYTPAEFSVIPRRLLTVT
jgi:diacylglycerol kinase (ATP)